ncbi:MAG: hypothetical protein ACRD6W_05760 [Nitrososphaerales archaeon]
MVEKKTRQSDLDFLDEEKFHQSGILLFGLIGGFTLTSMVVLLTQPETLVAQYSDEQTGEFYLHFLVTTLGIFSFWSIGTSFLMVVLGATKRPSEWENLTKFATDNLILVTICFVVLLASIVAPFSVISAFFIAMSSVVFALLSGLAFRRDRTIQRQIRKEKTEAQTRNTQNSSHSSGETPPTN